MKINDFISKKSISFMLNIYSICILLFAIFSFNFLINIYQQYRLDNMISKLQIELEEAENSTNLIILGNMGITESLEFRIYSIFISILISAIGVLLIHLIIKKLLAPLKKLNVEVSTMDIDDLRHEKVINLTRAGNKEVRELSEVLNKTFIKIYESYQREKEFSINLAHEIRTPLAVILAKIDIFMKKNISIDEETKEFIYIIQNNILRLSKLSEGVMLLGTGEVIKQEKVNINSIVEELIFDFEDLIDEKNINVKIRGEDISINTDESMLIRILYNLIENAIKYNIYNGSIDINLKADSQFVVIEISDTGKGIADADKEKIFDLFYRADKSRNREIEGYGIGLYLVNGMVKKLGGKITLGDNLPSGSIFRIEIKK